MIPIHIRELVFIVEYAPNGQEELEYKLYCKAELFPLW